MILKSIAGSRFNSSRNTLLSRNLSRAISTNIFFAIAYLTAKLCCVNYEATFGNWKQDRSSQVRDVLSRNCTNPCRELPDTGGLR